MELNHLKYFYFVAKEGGFSRASRTLKVAQPSITKTVKTLEQSLGIQLFERNGRSVALTKDGNDLFRKCEIIFAQVESIQSKAAFGGASSAIKGPICIGAAEPIASYLLPSILKHYLQHFPNVYPQVVVSTATEIAKLLKKRRIDLGLLFHAPQLPEGVMLKERFPIPYFLVVSSQHEKLESVCSSFIGSREVDDDSNKTYPTLSKLQKVYPNAEIRLSTNSLTAHKQLVLDGLGVSILPRFLVDEDIRSGKLSRLLPEENFVFDLKAVYRFGEVEKPTVKQFMEIFAKSMATYRF